MTEKLPIKRQAARNITPMSNDERRHHQRKKRVKKKKIIKWILMSALIMVAVIAVISACLIIFVKVSVVEVLGDDIYSKNRVIESSQIKIGSGVYTFSKNSAENNISTALPYVEKVKIKRYITGKVKIFLKKATPQYAIYTSGGCTLISNTGKVIEDGLTSVNDDIIIIESATLVSAKIGEVVQFSEQGDLNLILNTVNKLKSVGIEKITSINTSNHSNIKFGYDNRITVELGEESNINNNLMEFVKATLNRSDKETPEFKGTIDFTTKNTAYKRRQNDSLTTTPFVL